MENVLDRHPTVQLANGLVLCNFSSEHEFRFEDNSVLPPCSNSIASLLSMKSIECREPHSSGKWTDYVYEYAVTDAILRELELLEACQDVDVVIVPMPLVALLRVAKSPLQKPRGFKTKQSGTRLGFIDKFAK